VVVVTGGTAGVAAGATHGTRRVDRETWLVEGDFSPPDADAVIPRNAEIPSNVIAHTTHDRRRPVVSIFWRSSLVCSHEQRGVASDQLAPNRFGGPADSESPVALRPLLTKGLPFRRARGHRSRK
jgi:hypothetical protein